MFPALFTQVIGNPGESSGRLLAAFLFAVENAQGINFSLSLAIRAELVFNFSCCFSQGLSVSRAAPPTANRIDQGRNTLHPHFLEETIGHFYNFGINSRIRLAKDLHIYLMELTVASFLRAVITEHRTRVIETERLRLKVKAMFDDGSDHRGGVFWTKRD